MKKQTWIAVLTIILCMVNGNVSAYDFESGGIYYNYINNQTELEVTNGTSGYSGTVNIPKTVIDNGKTLTVTSIGERAFQNCTKLNSVTIPSSVTSIGNRAFRSCEALSSVTIPNSIVSIDTATFYGCISLTSVTIPNSVTSIGEWAFQNCTKLNSVTIPSSVTSIGRDAFAGCYGLEKVEVKAHNTVYDSRENCNAIIDTKKNEIIFGCKNTQIPNSVTSIGNGAFVGCRSMTSMTIPNSVTSIGNNAFRGCRSMTSVRIPSSVTSIGDYAFSGCESLESIKVDDCNPVYDSRENCNAIIDTKESEIIFGCKNTQIPNSVTSIGYAAFAGCSSLTSVTIPYGVTSIKDGAFERCSGLTSVTIPNSVKSIGSYAFSECSMISLTIPNSVMSIGHCAFWECQELTSVTIGNGIIIIGDEAFLECSNLNSVVSLIEKPFYIMDNTFKDISPNATLYITQGTKKRYLENDYIYGWGKHFSNIEENTDAAEAD